MFLENPTPFISESRIIRIRRLHGFIFQELYINPRNPFNQRKSVMLTYG